MENRNSWTEHLNISPAELESWKSEAPGDIPVLVWALREGKISFEAYARWAKGHYELAVLRHEFFTQAAPPPHAEVDQWSPWMVPVAQWESITYVGCVMPPPDPEVGLVYVLAHPKDLEDAYAKLAPSTMDDTVETVSESMPLPPDMSGFKLSLPDAPVDHPPESLTAEAPQGFTLNLNLPETPDSSTPPESLPPEVPPAEVLQNEEENLMTAVTQMTNVTRMTQVTTAAPHPASTGPALNEVQWWEEACQKFAHVLVLDASPDQFTLISQNGASMDGSAFFSAAQPSLFRIAYRTQKPYHGFVVENEIHSAFFKHLAMDTYPNTVTAIAAKGQILVFFGVKDTGMKDISAESELAEAEKLAANFPSLSGSAQAA